MTHCNHTIESATEENVTITVYDAADVSSLEETHTTDAAPKQQHLIHNTTRSAYHETIIDALGGSTSLDIKADAVALGDSTTDTANLGTFQALGNELFRSSTVDLDTAGQTLTARLFIDATEANGLTLDEAALIAERPSGELPINRFLLEDPSGLLDPKSRSETVTIDIEITQSDA
jgi:hypothetical protein